LESGTAKVALYCQIGGAIDMADFAIKGPYGALTNSGLEPEEVDLTFICWKTPAHTYDWLKANNFKWIEMEYDEGKGFLWNLYKGWNLGYEIGYQKADIVCPIATDHAFYKDWLKNLIAHVTPNRICCCKLIEPGTLPSLHTTKNLGVTVSDQFLGKEFEMTCAKLAKDELIFDDTGYYHIDGGVGGAYGHRLDAMPFAVPREVWEIHGPMLQIIDEFGVTGDTNFFDRCKHSGVEITKVLNAISYHSGGAETRRNMAQGVYT
jgi:hypothetical protein